MKQNLQLRVSQYLALTPQLQQSIRLLQLSTLELHQELEQILADNPLLERTDDPLDHSIRLLADGSFNTANVSADDTDTATNVSSNEGEAPLDAPGMSDTSPGNDNDWRFDDGARTSKAPEDDDARPQLEAHQTTLREHLLEQMRVTVHQQRDRALLEIIIDELNENGYLEESLEEIHEWLPTELEIEIEELSMALNLVQSFDPAGIGARNASECLALQIRRFPNVAYITRRMALSIVEHYLDLFAQRDFSKLRKILDCDDEDLREAQTIIKQCNPHPGNLFASGRSDYVVPDVIVKRNGKGWQVMLNREAMPRLRVNVLYANILKQDKNEGSLVPQLQEAKWLIKNMHQRFDTILRVAQAIVERQKNFFSHGAIAMRPLVLREIADTLGLHESTISRVTTQKYMLTPHGMFELKYFFGSHVATEAGGEASSTAIRALIKQLIGAEDPKNPFSDSKIAELLGEQGMVVARRTVAKYREALKLPPVNLRKSL
jgi:RNA polymerase sigma-54 factor